jgi:hypothetical protein
MCRAKIRANTWSVLRMRHRELPCMEIIRHTVLLKTIE